MSKKTRMMYPHLDRFQQMRFERTKFLLEELEQMKEAPMKEWLSHIAVRYGIARETGLKYIKDWIDGEFIVVQEEVIKFLRKPEEWK